MSESAGPSQEACRNAAAILMHALERIAREDAEAAARGQQTVRGIEREAMRVESSTTSPEPKKVEPYGWNRCSGGSQGTA